MDFGKVVTIAEIGSMMPAIVLTEKALKHLNKLRADQIRTCAFKLESDRGVAWECHM